MPPILVRKKYGYTASASKGSNKVIACSKADWGVVRDGSFIVLSGDDLFYKVTGKNKFVFQKDVTVLNSTQLKIEELVGAMVGVDDEIEFSFGEYNITGAEIDNPGEGYQVDDVLSPEGGVCKYNSIDQIDVPALLKVKEVGEDGKILSLEILSQGIYSLLPEDNCSTSSDLGQGATLNLTSKMSDIISIEGRTVTELEVADDGVTLHLNHPLPPRILNGKIKAEKWELVLNTEYTGEDKASVDYEIIKDFTPFCDLPLIHGSLASSHILYNESMAIIDQRLKDIEDKLG